jgi:hypothetical protein
MPRREFDGVKHAIEAKAQSLTDGFSRKDKGIHASLTEKDTSESIQAPELLEQSGLLEWYLLDFWPSSSSLFTVLRR